MGYLRLADIPFVFFGNIMKGRGRKGREYPKESSPSLSLAIYTIAIFL